MPPEIGGLAFDKNGNLYACLRRGDVLVTRPGKDRTTEWKALPPVCTTRWEWNWLARVMLLSPRWQSLPKLSIPIRMEWPIAIKTSPVILVLVAITMKPMPYALMVKGVFIALGTASHNSHFLYSERILQGAGEAEIFHPMTCADGLSVITKMESSAFASGFRMHNGITLSPDGEIWCGDNQGTGVAGLQSIVKPGSFNGHPSSLVWTQISMASALIFLPRKMLDDLYNKPLYNSTVPPWILWGTLYYRKWKIRAFQRSDAHARWKRPKNYPDHARESGRSTAGASTLFLTPRIACRWCTDRDGWFQKNDLLRIHHSRLAKPDEGLQRITYNGKTPFKSRTASWQQGI